MIAPSELCCSQRNLDAKTLRAGNDRFVQFDERLRSVDLRLTLAKQVEVRPVQNQNAHRPRFFGGKARASESEALMPDSLLAASNLDAGIVLVAAITTDLVAEIREAARPLADRHRRSWASCDGRRSL